MKNFTNLKTQFCFLLLMLTTFVAKAQTISQTYNASGTFTVPAGVTSITVEAWGGGGKGGSRSGAASTTGFGGGGGGAYSRNVIAVTPGQVYTVTVGAGSTSNASPGSDSEFVSPTSVVVVRAKGGSSAALDATAGAAGGSATAGIGGPIGVDRFDGGNGANGTTGIGGYGGGGGASAGTANNGAAGLLSAGGIGTNGGGNGGAGRTGAASGNGSSGTSPGGGGGGALKNGAGSPTGGNGIVGQIIVTYPIPEILVTGNFTSITDGDPTPSLLDDTDFGTSPIGVGVSKTYTIQNISSTTALTIGAITFSGVAAGDYAVTSAPSASVPAGGSKTVFLNL